MVCTNNIISEDYIDVLVRLRGNEDLLRRYQDICFQEINEKWVVLYENINDIPLINYSNYGYLTIPKLYGLMDQESMATSGILKVQNQSALSLKGSGVIIGFVDTGIDYLHEAFLDELNNTRIISIWDQNVKANVEDTPINFDFGAEYSEKQINDAIKSNTPYDIVPEKDEIGHGTFIAGIAAGSNTNVSFVGAAPQSDIVFVKLRQAKTVLKRYHCVPDDAIAYSESDIMLGIKYLVNKAIELDRPLVICFGLGSSMGPHTDGSPLSLYLSEVANEANIVVVTPAGNEGNERHHYSGLIDKNVEYESVEIVVGQGVTGFSVELWGKRPDVFSVEIISPSGEKISRIPESFNLSRTIDFVLENTYIEYYHNLVETIEASQVINMRFKAPSEGVWKIRVYCDSTMAGYYDMWLPIKNFLDGEVYFLDSTPYTTLLVPSSANAVITVSAYDYRNEAIWLQSGRGNAANGNIKPDIAAPGVEILGPAAGGNHDLYSRRNGSSIAAAHVAGAAALMLEWSKRNNRYAIFNTSDVKALLILGARRDGGLVYPNPEWGYGKLDLINTFLVLAGS